MSYEFNPRTQQYELPNPHLVENRFLLVTAAGLLAMGLAGMVMVRLNISRQGAEGLMPGLAALGPAIFIFIFGVVHGARLLFQLRFFYGRDQTAMLFGATDLGRDTEGATRSALDLRETLRQNSIAYDEPIRPIDTLLHTLIRDLIFAPPRVRHYCEQQFHNALLLCIVLVLFGVANIGLARAQASWVGLFYLGLVVYILWPRGEPPASVRALEVRGWRTILVWLKSLPLGLIGLTALSIVGPAALVLSFPGAAPFATLVNYGAIAALVLGLGLCSSILFLVALRHHTLRPQSTSATAATETVSMNAHPQQLLLELEREMQRIWTDAIPNRTYLRVRPTVSGEAGQFEGELIEETQPVPLDTGKLSFAYAFGSPEYRWLIVLDFFALSISLVGGGLLLASCLAPSIDFNLALSGAALVLNGFFAFGGSQWLWRRFRFFSRVYWVEFRGSFQVGRMDYGNVLQDRVKTQKQLINIEDMTLRAWVTEIDSVAFSTSKEADKRGRYIVGMRGLPDEADRATRLLADFGRQQSIVVAPSAARDLQRASAIQQLNTVAASAAPALAQQHSPAVVALVGGFCVQCGSTLQSGALFCDNCGFSLAGPSSRSTS